MTLQQRLETERSLSKDKILKLQEINLDALSSHEVHVYNPINQMA